MPEVVDTCSLASPASVCQTKHLHLRCSIDFTRRVLSGTAALTIQSQEDNLRSLVRWDMLPGARLSLATRLPSLTPLRPLPDACPPPASRIRRCSSSAHNPCSAPPLQPQLISQCPVFSPLRIPYRSLPVQLESLHSFFPTMYTCLLLHSFPPKPPSQFLDTSWCPFYAPLLTQPSSFILAGILLSPLILAPSAKAAPCSLPISSACSPELPPQAPEFFQSPAHFPQSTLSAKSQALCPADSQSHLSLPGPFISTCRSTGYDRITISLPVLKPPRIPSPAVILSVSAL